MINSFENKVVGVCIIKELTNIPCPSCGSTRSVIALSNGSFIDAFLINPFGYLIVGIMLIAPVWIVFDLIIKKESFLTFYKKLEFNLQKPRVAIPLILLVVSNWIWNITKGL
jgi:hypothetical protein